MMQSSAYVLLALFSTLILATAPGEKRTILTSGEHVYTIHYELGQSTVLYFGARPETVICGNKNYFNIEKIKEGVTIQPLGNFSTNLTVLNQGKRYLFYLTPSKGHEVDTFIEVKWVPEGEARELPVPNSDSKRIVRALGQSARLQNLEVRLIQEVSKEKSKRKIVEFEVKNISKDPIKVSELEVSALVQRRAIKHQVFVLEQDEIKAGLVVKGRLIITNPELKSATIIFKYMGQIAKIPYPEFRH